MMSQLDNGDKRDSLQLLTTLDTVPRSGLAGFRSLSRPVLP